MSTRRTRPLSRRLRPLIVVSLAAPLGMIGCVNQSEYDELYTTNRTLQERNVELRQQLEEQESTIALLRDRVQAGDETLSETQRRNSTLNDEIVRLRQNYRDLNDRLDNASVAFLDPKTDRALRELAARNPNLMTFDSSKGMVQFASDLTFGSGSAELQANAAQGLREFAQILSAADANYELRVVGHTDNVPVSRPETRQKHPTNVHLSVHRAISVRDALVNGGLPGDRIQVAGWGPFRPAVANPDRGGAAANRRVEIYILPSSWQGGAMAAAPVEGNDEPAPAATRRPETIK
ncbi:MAG: OmpA family protein [Planctomycetota bacterium]|nr:OmpA family protein [Planctomycetota bacterium]